MKTVYQDNKGRSWNLAISVATIKRVKATLGVDLLESLGGKLLHDLVADPIMLCDVIYVIAQPQAEAAGVTDEQFGEALAGDAIDRAAAAFLEGLAGFFARPDQRKVIRTVAEKIDAALKEAERVSLENLDKIDPAAAVREALASHPPPSSGG